MIDVFDEQEGQLLRRLFAYSVENPIALRNVDLSILGAKHPPSEGAATVDPTTTGGPILELLSRISVASEGGQDALDLVDRISVVMLVGYRRGFFAAAERAGLPTSEGAMTIVDLYPGLDEACAQYSLLEASTVSMQAHSRLASLQGRKELVHETLELLQRSLQRSMLQGYRTGALAADALRGTIPGELASMLRNTESPPDDPGQNRAIGTWLAAIGWENLQREIVRHQTTAFWTRLERAGRAIRASGLPGACTNWTEAGDDYMGDVLVAIAQAGIRTGMRLQLQSVSTRPAPPSDREVRLTYRVSRSIALLARQWSSWHPAPKPALQVRQVGEHLTAPTFASGAALGHMMGEALAA